MFNFFKRKEEKHIERDEKDKNDETLLKGATGITATHSARESIDQAAETFAKPEEYAGNRHLYDSAKAKRDVKLEAFKKDTVVRDPYTNEEIYLTKAEALLKGGKDALKRVAESDHITPLKRIFEWYKKDPWIKNEDINKIGNSRKNMEAVSREINNGKRSRTNEEFVTDEEYLKKTGIKLSEEGKKKAIESGKKSQAFIRKQAKQRAFKNIVTTGHEAGINAAKNTGSMVAALSGIRNITSLIKGEKSAEEAIEDTVIDTGKAVATSYAMSGGLTTVSHSLSASSSKTLQALAKSNLPGYMITALMMTGDTLKRYSKGEISTQECLLELGGKGLSSATMGYSAAVGSNLFWKMGAAGNVLLPGVGAVVGALVGSAMTSHYYNELMTKLKTKQLEHEERMRIIAECEEVAREARAYREELEIYIEKYLAEYKACFSQSLSEIYSAFETGDADGVIAGANKITRKLGGNVYYETVAEFEDYLADGSVDIL